MNCKCGGVHGNGIKCKYNQNPKLRDIDLEKKQHDSKKHYTENRDEILEKQLQYKHENRKQVNQTASDYYWNRGGKEVKQEYKQNNREKLLEYERQRRAKIMSDPILHQREKERKLASYHRNKS